MASELHLRVVTPDRTIIDRKVKSVVFQGVDGGYGSRSQFETDVRWVNPTRENTSSAWGPSTRT